MHGAAFPRAPRHVSARFRMRPPALRLGHARGRFALIEAGMTASKSKAVAACKANRADDGAVVARQELGPRGAGGGAQGTRGVGHGVPARPGLVGAAWDRHSSGDGGGEWAGPSTCSSTLQSAGDAGEAAFLFFLDLVIIGEMSSPVEAAASTGAICSCRLLLQAAVGCRWRPLLLLQAAAAG